MMKKPKNEKEYDLELNLINCINYFYIKNACSYGVSLDNFIIDGVKPEKTFKNEWYKVNTIPKEIKSKRCNKRINERYVLKDGYTASEIMPQIIYEKDLDEYEEIINLYRLEYDEIDDGYDIINFNIIQIYERKDFEFVDNPYNAKVNIMTQIECPKEAYQDKACYVSSEQMFEIIRTHVKKYINTDYAKIDSDYDFHFEVVKKIKLSDPYKILVDKSYGSLRNKKPKWVEVMISEKKVSILNITNKHSTSDYGKNCIIPPSINGENYEDLSKKINEYLEDVLKNINKKYCECPNCSGWGIIEEDL